LSTKVEFNKRTCGFVREVPAGNQGAALAHGEKNDPKTRRLVEPAKEEVGGFYITELVELGAQGRLHQRGGELCTKILGSESNFFTIE
jgi:hypothetical protein